MRDFRKKRSCLKTNRAVTSLACPGVISRLWPDQPLMVCFVVTVWGERTTINKHVQHNHGQKYPLHCWWTVLTPPYSSARLIRPWTKYCRKSSSRLSLFWGNFFLSFWRKSLIDRSLKDLAILFRAFLAYLAPFQSYGGFKKLEQSILLILVDIGTISGKRIAPTYMFQTSLTWKRKETRQKSIILDW